MLVLSFPHFLLTTLKVDHYFAAIVGVILNTFIVVGLNLKRSNSLGTYRWFLMAHAGNDLLSAVTMGSIELCCDYSYGSFMMLINGPTSYFGQRTVYVVFCIFAASYLLNILLLALTFVYRYFQICKKQHLNLFSKPLCMLFIVILMAFPVMLVIVFSPLAYTYSEDFYADTGVNQFNVVLLYVDHVKNPFFITICGTLIGLAMISYGLVFFCCKAIFAYLNKAKDALTAKTRKTQRLLTVVLLLQSLTPALTSTFPGCGLVIALLMQLDIRLVTWIISGSFVWLPILNAIITLTFVSPLRSMLLRKKVEHIGTFSVMKPKTSVLGVVG